MSKEKKTKKKEQRTYIGGQAVLEGVMMRGKTSYATAVRDPEGNIQVEKKRLSISKHMRRASKIPLVRGAISMIESLCGLPLHDVLRSGEHGGRLRPRGRGDRL